MDSNPFLNLNFVDLLQSQQDSGIGLESSLIPLFGTQATEDSNFEPDSPLQRKERRSWSQTDDEVLISSWLNTRKDAVVGTEQKSGAFWKRIVDYFAASPKLAGLEKREPLHCKNRWHKINDLVCKFCGAYEAAARQKTSGQNENDILKQAHLIFLNNNKKNSLWNMRGRSFAMTRSGVIYLHREPQKREKERTMLNPQHLTQLRMWLVKRLSGPLVLRLPSAVEQWEWNNQRRRSSIMLVSRAKKLYYACVTGEEALTDCFCHGLKKLCETPPYPENFFRRRFRMNKPLFMHIVDRLSTEVDFFRQKKDGLGRLGLSALQKCTAAIRLLAYGTAADTVDEYLRLGETTSRPCLENFVEGIIHLFGDEYLRIPTPADLQRLLDIGEYRGFPGMIGSIDCMHWEWKNCPTAWKGQYSRGSGTLNDINVLDCSPVFDDIINGQAPQVTYSVNGRGYHFAYYLTDGIYPKWATFIHSISLPQGPKAILFAQQQEAVRKDVERTFGVLQARFAIVKNPALFGDKVKIGKIMRACIILHNMIVEDERDGYTQFNLSEFQVPTSRRQRKFTCGSQLFNRYPFKYRQYDGCSN
uniref:Myb-like domain-containing protein n=1 Tax=Brassica oleracea var. oleracea TaxID=109376 RepID=A0A0D2ZTG1_BRAOL